MCLLFVLAQYSGLSYSRVLPIYFPITLYMPRVKSILKRMVSHKTPDTHSGEETYFDDPQDKVNSEQEKAKQALVKRLAFERECIKDEFSKQKRVMLLEENSSRRSHYRSQDYVLTTLSGEPNIRSTFRFNLKDVSSQYNSKSSQLRKNMFISLTSSKNRTSTIICHAQNEYFLT